MTKKGKHTVLFICLGNICRSPAGEGIMKSLVEKAGLQDEFEIDSAGIGNWHVGQLPDSRMRKCGAEHGYNFNSHARQFQKSDFGRFETIVVMDNENYRAITSMASCQADKDNISVLSANFTPICDLASVNLCDIIKRKILYCILLINNDCNTIKCQCSFY